MKNCHLLLMIAVAGLAISAQVPTSLRARKPVMDGIHADATEHSGRLLPVAERQQLFGQGLENANEAMSEDEVVDQISSKDGERRNAAYLRMQQRRAREVAELLDIVTREPEEYPDEDGAQYALSKLAAVRLLGKYRAVEAAPELTKQIAYSSPYLVSTESHPLKKYPAALSLIEIGLPSLEQIQARLWRPASEKELTLFAHVIYFVEGREVGRCRLKHWQGADRLSEEARQNLQRLIALYEENLRTTVR